MAKKTAASRPAHPAATAPAPTTSTARRVVLKVRATMTGYYDHVRRREGDVFVLAKIEDFSAKWMEAVDPSVREKVTSAPEALKRHHDELLREKYVPTGSQQVSDEDTRATGALNPLLA